MDWLFPSIIATFIGSCVLTVTYLFLYRSDPKPFLLIWTFAWCLYALRFIFMLCYLRFDSGSNIFLFGNQLASLWSGMLLLWGTYTFIERRFPKKWLLLSIPLSIYILVVRMLLPEYSYSNLPIYLLLGWVFIWTGFILLRQQHFQGKASKLVGVLFVFWGLHKADYPFLQPLVWIAPWGYMLGAVLEVLVAIGMLMIYFQRAQQQIIDSRENYRLIVENQNDFIVKLDARQHIIYASPSYCHIFGISENELRDFDFKTLIHPEDIETVSASLSSLYETRHTTYHQERARTVNGWRWFAWSAKAVLDADGNVFEVVSVGRDITERVQSESALRENEAYMRSIFRVAPVGIGVVEKRIFKQVNDKFCDLLGYSRQELIGNSSRMVYPSDEGYARVGQDKYNQIRETGSGTVETVLKHKDGHTLDVLLSSTPISSDIPGSPVTFTALDISDIKEIEKSLKESEAKYRFMMEAIKDPVCIYSQDFRLQYLNPAMIQRIGHDATGEYCYAALHGYAEKCPWCQEVKSLDDGFGESDIISPLDNRSFHISSSVYVNTDGSLSKISVFRDTTELKKLQSRLQQAQKMESIGNLAGGIAHDFNNILFPIVGMAEMFLDDFTPGSLEYENMKEIFKAAMRGGELVKQILAFSRQSERKLMPIRFQQILKEVIRLSRSTIPTSIEIDQSIQKDCGLVMADPTQIHQIAMNLITNAYHAIGDTNGKISIQLREQELENDQWLGSTLTSGKYAVFSVADTGCGIPPEIMDQIFEPYFTTKEQEKGTGLGLAVVYGIVKEFQGDIKVESQPGQGTVFKVFLPIMQTHDEIIKPDQDAPDPLGHEHILLVDDEEAIMRLELQMLERLGYEVTARASAVDALAAFKANPDRFDLILTDMTMPHMTGDQLAKEVLSLRPGIPIIICTGFSEQLNKERARTLGINGFLMKPAAKSDMAKIVRRVLDEAGGIDRGDAMDTKKKGV